MDQSSFCLASGSSFIVFQLLEVGSVYDLPSFRFRTAWMVCSSTATRNNFNTLSKLSWIMMPSDYQSNAEIWFNFNLSQDTVSLQIAIGPRHLPVIGETVFQRFFIFSVSCLFWYQNRLNGSMIGSIISQWIYFQFIMLRHCRIWHHVMMVSSSCNLGSHGFNGIFWHRINGTSIVQCLMDSGSNQVEALSSSP